MTCHCFGVYQSERNVGWTLFRCVPVGKEHWLDTGRVCAGVCAGVCADVCGCVKATALVKIML